MELWVLEATRDTKVKRERRVTAVCRVLQDCPGGQVLWAQKESPSLALQDRSVPRVNPVPLGSDDPVPEGHPALLDPQEPHLHLDRAPVSRALLVRLAQRGLQEMTTLW